MREEEVNDYPIIKCHMKITSKVSCEVSSIFLHETNLANFCGNLSFLRADLSMTLIDIMFADNTKRSEIYLLLVF